MVEACAGERIRAGASSFGFFPSPVRRAPGPDETLLGFVMEHLLVQERRHLVKVMVLL